MLDYIEIGPTPAEEPCEQANVSATNVARMRAECHAFIGQIRRQFGTEPEGARLALKFNRDGNYGYYEVVCHFNSTLPASIDYAYKIEGECPLKWDNQAKAELAQVPVGVQA